MLVMVVLLFGLCWMPLHVFMLVYDYSNIGETMDYHAIKAIYYTVHWLAMSNSFVNPIIYSFLNDSFRVSVHLGIA